MLSPIHNHPPTAKINATFDPPAAELCTQTITPFLKKVNKYKVNVVYGTYMFLQLWHGNGQWHALNMGFNLD